MENRAQHITDHRAGNIDTCGSNTIAELHRSVDLVDQVAMLLVLKHIDRKNATAHGLGRTHAEIVQLRSDRAIGSNCSTCSIGNPMLAATIDRADRTIANDEGSDITLGFLHIFLNIMNMMLIRAER